MHAGICIANVHQLLLGYGMTQHIHTLNATLCCQGGCKHAHLSDNSWVGVLEEVDQLGPFCGAVGQLHVRLQEASEL